jgi:transposase
MCLYYKHMKPNVRIKRINGKEYWYEDTPYYDNEKKQIRYHSRYLGKNVNGVPLKVRTEIPEAEGHSTPRAAHTYGHLIPLQTIIQDLHLDRYLKKTVKEPDAQTILTLALNRVVRPMAMHGIQTWYEETSLILDHPELPLTSQNISELLSEIGESGIPEQFMGELVRASGTQSTFIYDITSLSGYSQLLNLLEYGYNRDGLDLPQLNLSLVLDKEKGIPVMYDIYPGSIVDVSTLKNTILKIRSLGIDHYTLVLDRGFFSQGNLEELLAKNLTFIIPAATSLKEIKELLTEVQRDLTDPQYLQKYHKNPLFVKPVTFSLHNMKVNGFCYYDPKREQDERNLLYIRLHDMKVKLESVRIPKWRKPEDYFKELAGKLMNFFAWTLAGDKFVVSIKTNAVTQRLNRMGNQIIFSTGNLDWMECLSCYRERDAVEKAFRAMKHDLLTLPLNARKESTVRGFLFVNFISLIIRMRLLRLMKDSDLIKEFTADGLLLELSKIKKIQLANGDIIVSEITKKQRTILEALHLCA